MELANAVVEACAATRADPSSSFKLLYPSEASIKVSLVCNDATIHTVVVKKKNTCCRYQVLRVCCIEMGQQNGSAKSMSEMDWQNGLRKLGVLAKCMCIEMDQQNGLAKSMSEMDWQNGLPKLGVRAKSMLYRNGSAEWIAKTGCFGEIDWAKRIINRRIIWRKGSENLKGTVVESLRQQPTEPAHSRPSSFFYPPGDHEGSMWNSLVAHKQ